MNHDVDQPEQTGNDKSSPTTYAKPLRIWPAAILLIAMLLARFLPQTIENAPPWVWMVAAFGPVLCGILMLLWWVAGSRATWREKGIGLLGVIVLFAMTLLLVDISFRGPAMMVMTIPIGIAAFAIGAILFRGARPAKRTTAVLVLAALGFNYSTLLRSDGLWGNYALGLHWRWEPTSEQLLGSRADRQADIDAVELERTFEEPQWPGFRGPHRDAKQRGTTPATDWNANPPELLWKIVVGPGWSSFAVNDGLLFTQEQRGNEETVVCYDAETGLEIWTRAFEGRLVDPLGGPGPRSTPTLANGGLFTMSPTGHLARLEPATGKVVWEQDLRKLTGKDPPMWGFSSSPLVVDSLVMVYAGGEKDQGVIAFDVDSGERRWSAAAGPQSYSSPHLAEILGERFVLSLSNTGLDFLDPQTGAAKLHYDWPIEGYRSLQPQVFGADSVVVPSELGEGTVRVRLVKDSDGFSIKELWQSRGLKPDFNDFVIYEGHAYGFDGIVFACIDLETGQQKWKGGRYGKGQVLLLEDAGLLLVMSEKGQAVLLKADPAKHVELTKFQALTGKTWNHPVVIGDRLYVRNSQEAAAYRLPLVAGSGSAERSVTD